MNPMHDLKSSLIALFSSSPAFYLLTISPTALTIVASIVLPCIFFVISQIINVKLQIYLKNREK
jgi:hypothetical protein